MKEKLAYANHKLIAVASSALLLVAFCVVKSAGSPGKRSAGQVVTLSKIDQLKEAFQRDAGMVRFVTILSPT